MFRAAFGANFDDLLNNRFGYTTAMSNHRQYRMGRYNVGQGDER